ncbi:hypothetical protein KY362_05190 [Candidatus Woesearchaeota archaeon]|nr:hypothetical protein [Candidatus Woesearchaeota archaeon]
MKTRNKVKIIVALIIIVVLLNWSTIADLFRNSGIGDVTGQTVAPTRTILQEDIAEPDVYFCPADDCAGELVAWLGAAEEYVHCAFFELELEEVIEALDGLSAEIDVKLVTDDRYYDQVSDLGFAKHDNRSGLMHNKFCVLDGKAVWTGSFNPTARGAYHNNNNAVFYQSSYLANAYEEEFQEMWTGTFGKGPESSHTEFVLNGYPVESYFCPEDWCANKVIYALQDANSRVDFMTFSFTHDDIGEQIISLAEDGVDIRGVFEKSQNNAYTEKVKFEEAGIDVRWDGNSANMHHKVFIIDNTTVVTGSFNPSKNADTRNDENLLIIHDPAVAAAFASEFEKVWAEAAAE